MTKLVDNYANLVKNYDQLEQIDLFKISSPIKINNDCLKGLTDKIFNNKNLQGINFFHFENIPLFKYDNLGNYFVPKLLYRGFQVLYLDMSEISIGEYEMDSI